MNIKDILIVGVALAMDAFGVTISIGLNKRVNRSKKIGFIISFALFQFLFFFSGAIMGFLFEKYITAIPNIIGGTAIGIVGAMMIKEGFEKNENEDLVLKKYYVFNFRCFSKYRCIGSRIYYYRYYNILLDYFY